MSVLSTGAAWTYLDFHEAILSKAMHGCLKPNGDDIAPECEAPSGRPCSCCACPLPHLSSSRMNQINDIIEVVDILDKRPAGH